ncbi:MAG: hypothetical protein HUK13_02390 [Muribaculaceae bacterium]|nr:hypothetical protein [Muribaculaceae bacterium]
MKPIKALIVAAVALTLAACSGGNTKTSEQKDVIDRPSDTKTATGVIDESNMHHIVIQPLEGGKRLPLLIHESTDITEAHALPLGDTVTVVYFIAADGKNMATKISTYKAE